jgi:hypothetical protein
VNTVESSHINTPVVGEVLRDVYQNGHLIVPAGAVVSSFAQSGAVRDRIEVAGMWLIVYPDGRYLRIHGIACDREADPSNQQFGIEDGSAGLQGELVVVATSNVGSRVLMESRSTDRETLIRRTVLAGTTDFRPETFARFDLQCVFNKLDYESLKQIGELHSTKCLELINSLGHDITLQPGVIEYVQREGYSEKFGARPMQNAAMRILGDVVSQEMLKNGGLPVYGAIEYDRRRNQCFLK